ncbi:MAG: hypothetical protein EAZ89_17975 [Bacteroidetes bacterium]|jgi:hypothetical protein|nr:MAG: hypothetical protein EAZ89_17975 [Bacteroidota bacterium]
MDEKESLRLITEMIDAARNRVRKGEGNISMAWGYVVMLASLGHFFADRAGYPAEAPYAWLLIFGAILYTLVFSIRQQKKDRTSTHIDRILDHLWLGFSICMMTIGFMGAQMGNASFSVIELFYGLALFVSGAAFRFKPLIYGGIWCWIAAWVSLFVEFPYHLLILAASVLGYILPGWLLNRKAYV